MGGVEPSGDFFWAQSVNPGGWYKVYADRLAVGSRAEVWVDRESAAKVDEAEAKAIVAEFDTAIDSPIRDAFGDGGDVDGNGRIIILILDIRDGFVSGSGAGYVAGYFDSTHLYSRESRARSNEADMIFMDSYPLVPGSDPFYSTVAHEYQHLINYHRNVFEENGAEQEIWLNEGLSSAAESVYQQSLVDWKVNFFTNPSRNEAISRGASFLRWDGSLSSYSTVYLFFQWLRIQANPARAGDGYDGDGVFLSIQNNRYPDYRAVEQALGVPWDTLLRNWYAANYYSGMSLSDPRFGYAGQIEFPLDRFPFLQGFDEGLTLYPGGGVYRRAATDKQVSGDSDIRYALLPPGGPLDAATSLDVQAQDVFVAFHISPDPRGGGAATSALPAAVPEDLADAGVRSLSLSLAGEPGYPIDTVFSVAGEPRP